MQYEKINTKYTNINTTESRHSEMGPVRQNPIQTDRHTDTETRPKLCTTPLRAWSKIDPSPKPNIYQISSIYQTRMGAVFDIHQGDR